MDRDDHADEEHEQGGGMEQGCGAERFAGDKGVSCPECRSSNDVSASVHRLSCWDENPRMDLQPGS